MVSAFVPGARVKALTRFPSFSDTDLGEIVVVRALTQNGFLYHRGQDHAANDLQTGCFADFQAV